MLVNGERSSGRGEVMLLFLRLRRRSSSSWRRGWIGPLRLRFSRTSRVTRFFRQVTPSQDSVQGLDEGDHEESEFEGSDEDLNESNA